MSAMAAVELSAQPGGPAPEPVDLDVVRRSSAHLLAESAGGSRLRAAAAVILAHSRAGAVSEATALAEEEIDRAAKDPEADPVDLTALFTAASEAYVTAGWLRRSTPLAQQALAYAQRQGDDAALFRSRSLLALSRALNGEYDDARVHADSARALQRTNDWATSFSALPLLLAETLLASASLDAPALDALAAELRAGEPDSPVWRAASTSTEAMSLLLRGDANRGIPLLHTVIGSTDDQGIYPMIRGFAIGIYADLLLARGEARRVLTLLTGRASPPGHSLCFDMQRSAAHLLLGEDRAALMATDGCMRLGPDHCLRTVPPLLLRRAIAQLRLGQVVLADESFEAAFHLLQTSRSATPLLTLPSDPLIVLCDRLEQRRPEDADAIEQLRMRLAAVPPVDSQRSALPALTERERVLATRLRSGQTAVATARDLHVSLNTVKTQLRSLYRKLQVRTREDAIAALERAGFFD